MCAFGAPQVCFGNPQGWKWSLFGEPQGYFRGALLGAIGVLGMFEKIETNREQN